MADYANNSLYVPDGTIALSHSEEGDSLTTNHQPPPSMLTAAPQSRAEVRCLFKNYLISNMSHVHIQLCTPFGPQQQACQVWSSSEEWFLRYVNQRKIPCFIVSCDLYLCDMVSNMWVYQDDMKYHQVLHKKQFKYYMEVLVLIMYVIMLTGCCLYLWIHKYHLIMIYILLSWLNNFSNRVGRMWM